MKYLASLLALCATIAIAQQPTPPSVDEVAGQLLMCIQQRDASNGASINAGGKLVDQIAALQRENAKLKADLESAKKEK